MPDTDKKLEEQVKIYADLAKENKNVDVAGLMMNALQRQEENKLSARSKHWAYLISLGLPPLGLIFAIRFWLSDKDDGNNAAIMCVVLTIFSIALGYATLKTMISSSGVNVNQVEQIKPQDILQLNQ